MLFLLQSIPKQIHTTYVKKKEAELKRPVKIPGSYVNIISRYNFPNENLYLSNKSHITMLTKAIYSYADICAKVANFLIVEKSTGIP